MNCPYCNSKPFKSQRGLTQHQQHSRKCLEAIRSKYGILTAGNLPHTVAPFALVPFAIDQATLGKRCAKSWAIEKNVGELDKPSQQLAKRLRTNEENDIEENLETSSASEQELDFPVFDANSDDSVQLAHNLAANTQKNGVNTKILEDWQEYCRTAPRKFMYDMCDNDVNAINLLVTLRKTKAALKVYDEVMKWHYQVTGKLQKNLTNNHNRDFVSRKKLFRKLSKRFNFTPEKKAYIEELTLPHSRARVKIVLNDPQWVIQSLLTDPRITDNDYIFGNKSPFLPPKNNNKYIQDLNWAKLDALV